MLPSCSWKSASGFPIPRCDCSSSTWVACAIRCSANVSVASYDFPRLSVPLWVIDKLGRRSRFSSSRICLAMKVDRSFSTASTCGMPRVVREIVATLLAFACYQRSMTFRTYAPRRHNLATPQSVRQAYREVGRMVWRARSYWDSYHPPVALSTSPRLSAA